MKKDVERTSVNTVRATFLLQKQMVFRKYQWKSPYVSNDCLWKLYF